MEGLAEPLDPNRSSTGRVHGPTLHSESTVWTCRARCDHDGARNLLRCRPWLRSSPTFPSSLADCSVPAGYKPMSGTYSAFPLRSLAALPPSCLVFPECAPTIVHHRAAPVAVVIAPPGLRPPPRDVALPPSCVLPTPSYRSRQTLAGAETCVLVCTDSCRELDVACQKSLEDLAVLMPARRQKWCSSPCTGHLRWGRGSRKDPNQHHPSHAIKYHRPGPRNMNPCTAHARNEDNETQWLARHYSMHKGPASVSELQGAVCGRNRNTGC